MPLQNEAQERETGRIVPFPTHVSRQKDVSQGQLDESRVADLRKFEQSAEPDDYARRMMINVAAFAVIVVLTLMGIWLAEQLALLRKHQDCALSGRKNCAEIDTQIRAR